MNKNLSILVSLCCLSAGCGTLGHLPAETHAPTPTPALAGREDAVSSPTGSVPFGAAAYTPDGSRYARELTPPGGGTIGIFDTRDNRLLTTITAQSVPNDLKGLCWSPDGLTVAVMYHGGDPSGITIYDAAGGASLRRIPVEKPYHVLSFRQDNRALLAAESPQGRIEELPLRATDFVRNSGVNLPWLRYGWDVGRNPWGVTHGGFSSNRDSLKKEFLYLKGCGVEVVRIFIFCDLRSGILFDEHRLPRGYDGFVMKDFQTLLDTAQDTGLRIIPVLFDYTIADGISTENGAPVGEHPDVLSDPTKRLALFRTLRPFLARFATHPAVFAWEVVNEPEHIVDVPESAMEEFIGGFVALIHGAAPGARVTVGNLRRDDLPRWRNAGLDIYQFHYYDGLEPQTPFDSPVREMGLDKPVILGEILPDTIIPKLDTAWRNGCAGILFWSLTDGNFREHADLFKAWMSVH